MLVFDFTNVYLLKSECEYSLKTNKTPELGKGLKHCEELQKTCDMNVERGTTGAEGRIKKRRQETE